MNNLKQFIFSCIIATTILTFSMNSEIFEAAWSINKSTLPILDIVCIGLLLLIIFISNPLEIKIDNQTYTIRPVGLSLYLAAFGKLLYGLLTQYQEMIIGASIFISFMIIVDALFYGAFLASKKS